MPSNPTLRKALLWAGLMLLGIIAGRTMRGPAAPDPLVPKLEAERDSLRLVVATAQAFLDSTRPRVDSIGVFLAKTALVATERKRQAAHLAAEPVAQDTQALRQRADTLWKLYATCSVEVDSVNDAADRLLGAYRGCAKATGDALAAAMRAEGMLNQARVRIEQLSGRSRFQLGLTVGAVGGLDRAGPWYGPGAALGATLRVRLPLVGLPVGATVGGVAGLDLTGKPRVGVGAGVGVSF